MGTDTDFLRRRVIQAGVAAGVAAAVPGAFAAAPPMPLSLIVKTIPSTGEKIPAVGTGTNAYGTEDPAEIKRVLTAMPGLGGAVIDTAQGYANSEVTIGRLLAEIGNRDRFFIATKTPIAGSVAGGTAVLDESFRRLQVSKIDLLQIHNLNGVDVLYPHFKDYKAAGRIRYLGITTSQDRQYTGLLDAVTKNEFDFLQVDYNIADRSAAEKVLPYAQEKGLGVLINSPFGGRATRYSRASPARPCRNGRRRNLMSPAGRSSS